MKHDFNMGDMTAFNVTIQMKQKTFYTNPFAALIIIQEINTEKEENECFHSTQILQSKYDKTDIATVIQQQMHLTKEQQTDLQAVLGKHTILFSAKLGHYRKKQMHLELLPGAKLVHAKSYPVPHAQWQVFQKELQRLVQLGVLLRVGGTCLLYTSDAADE